MKVVFALTAALALAPASIGCSPKPALSVAPTDNAEFEVHVLFTKDGCTVYRFQDLGYHYFVRCDGRAPNERPQATTMQTVSCGKSCTREETIPTAAR